MIVDPLVVCWPSNLIRPRNLLLYKDDATLPELAATLIYGLAKNYCFNDGNKRVSAIAGGIFLEANGIVWRSHSDDLVKEILAIAANAPIGVQQSVGAGATGAGGCGATARLEF